MGPQRFWGHKFDLLGSCDVIGHVAIGLGICGFLLEVHCNHASILHLYGDMGPQIYWGHDLDFWGHVTSSITWPSDSAWALSYWLWMIIVCLSCTDTEIRGPKILYCIGYVTSHAKFHVSLLKGGFSANRWNIRKNFSSCTYTFFSETHLQVRPFSGFLRAMVRMMRSHARMCLLGVKNLKLIFNIFIQKMTMEPIGKNKQLLKQLVLFSSTLTHSQCDAGNITFCNFCCFRCASP